MSVKYTCDLCGKEIKDTKDRDNVRIVVYNSMHCCVPTFSVHFDVHEKERQNLLETIKSSLENLKLGRSNEDRSKKV